MDIEHRRRARRRLALLLFCGLWVVGACAAPAAGFSQPYTWQEQGCAQRVWLDPTLVAELAPVADGVESNPAAVIPGLTPMVSPWRGVRLWKLPAGQDPGQAIGALDAAGGGGSFVPVFRDAPDAHAPMRLLGHEITVSFPADWNDARVAQWAGQQSLTVIRKMSVGVQTYVLRSPLAGAQLLQLVDRLQQAGTVQAVYPNWRRAVTVR